MKNIGLTAILCTASIFLGIMVGILIDRFSINNAISLVSAEAPPHIGPIETIYIDENTGKININFASAKELSMIPGIGITTGERIVAYRQKHGMFISIDDLCKVSGIGEKTLESIKPYVTVGG